MIDANSQFFAILTNVGMAKQANADALGIPWKFNEMGVGDANNTDPIPSASQTRLINEWRRRPLNQVRVDPANPAVIIAEQIIPADEGGRWIREIGVYDADGDLVAVANCAPTYKSLLSQGSGRTQVVRMNFIVSSTGNITLKIDPAVVLATREYVDLRIMEELYKLDSKQSVRVATTANIALAGLQTIDGIVLVASDRVLVKNQAVAKDNGLYIAAAGVWARAPDANSNAEVTSALLVSVEQGATLADTRWQLITDGVIVLGVTALTFQNVTQGFAPINSPAFLGTPTATTPPLFANDKLLATTEYVMRASGNYRGFTNAVASATLTAGAVGTLVSTIGAFTLTLPAANAVPSGSAIHFRNIGNGVVTVTCAGADWINGGNGNQPISILLQPGATLALGSNGANAWWASGSAQLQFSKVFGYTPDRFDNTKLFATTEFVKQMGMEWGSFSSVSASTTLSNGSVGSIVNVGAAAAVTITLPPTAPIASGGMIKVVSGGAGAVTISGSNGEICTNLSGSAISLVLGQGDSAILARLSGEWRLVGGSVALRHAAMFAGSTSTSGHQKLPNGQQECRGTFIASATPGAPVAVSFPLGFGRVDEVVITPVNASTTTSSAWHDSASSSGFNGRCNIPSAVCHYIAKGAAA
ncbi:phage tail protein [Pseudomonas sp. SH10-3B]|uniref:phage tail protein n=1 Tax=Pseudomonas sp. SH10-3B TaxID=2816049 RepID=UPI001CA71F01|nr:phage tail protein [Pseudomonas sp. SH10-3B]MBY8945167.1 phage tail protein [Pseudomonas sp. SH10-3B]